MPTAAIVTIGRTTNNSSVPSVRSTQRFQTHQESGTVRSLGGAIAACTLLANQLSGAGRTVVVETRSADSYCTHLDTQPSVARPPMQWNGRNFAFSALATKTPVRRGAGRGKKGRPLRLVARQKRARKLQYAHVPRFGLCGNAPSPPSEAGDRILRLPLQTVAHSSPVRGSSCDVSRSAWPLL